MAVGLKWSLSSKVKFVAGLIQAFISLKQKHSQEFLRGHFLQFQFKIIFSLPNSNYFNYSAVFSAQNCWNDSNNLFFFQKRGEMAPMLSLQSNLPMATFLVCYKNKFWGCFITQLYTADDLCHGSK